MTLQPVAARPVDAELLWIVYLRGALVGRGESYASNVFFYRRVPDTRKDRMVIVRRDGGAVGGVFDNPRVSLDVWAMTEQDAIDLADLLVGLALKAPLTATGVTEVAHVGGPNSVPEASGQFRRLTTIQATHRAALVT